MQTQTVFKAGNSYVVSIPKHLAKELNIKSGQKVSVEKDENGSLVIRKSPKKKSLSRNIEFKKWWNEFLKENAGILDELAVR